MRPTTTTTEALGSKISSERGVPMPVPSPSPPSVLNAPGLNGRTSQHQACERCWKRKQKCDKLLPACSSCAVLGIACTQRGLDYGSHLRVPSYVTSLKRKIEELERVSQEKRACLRTDSTSPEISHPPQIARHPSEVDNVSGDPPTSSPAQNPHSSSGDEGSARATIGEIGYLSLSAMAESRHHIGEFTRQLSVENMVIAATDADGIDVSGSTLYHAPNSKSSGFHSIVASYPITGITKEATSSYVDRFINEIGISLPCFDRENIMADFEGAITDFAAGVDMGNCVSSSLRDFTILMAITIGASISPESSRIESFIVSLHTAAMKRFPAILQIDKDVATVQCMLLLIIYSIYSPQGGSTWHLTGLAMKKCIASRFHKEPDVHMGLTQRKLNDRRRLFWSLYIVDRSISSVMDRPFSIQDEDISVRVPFNLEDSEDSEAPAEMSLSQHLITQARLISNIRTRVQSDPLFNYSNLCFWRELPLELRHLTSTSQHIHERLEQLSCRTLLQIVSADSRPETGYRNMINSYNTVEDDTIASCVRFISQLYDRSDHGVYIGSLMDGYDIFTAGIVYLCVTFRTRASREPHLAQTTKFVNKCSTLLTVIGVRFVILKTFRRVLNAVSSKCIESLTSDDTGSTLLDILHDLPAIIPSRIRRFINIYLNAEQANYVPTIRSASGTSHSAAQVYRSSAFEDLGNQSPAIF